MALQRDYLVQMILQFIQAMMRSAKKSKEKDPAGAADTLEAAIGAATDIDGAVLLSLSEESVASILQVSGTDPRVAEYIANSMNLEGFYLDQAGDPATADLRRRQAQALALAYGFEVAPILSEEDADALIERAQSEQ